MRSRQKLIRTVVAALCVLAISSMHDIVFAGPLDANMVKNDDPRAMPRGLYFHSSIPIERREILLKDLVWLASLGALSEAEDLAQLLAIKRTLTGATLVAWLIERVVIISSPQAFGNRNNGIPVVISGARPDLGILVFDARKRKSGKPVWEPPLSAKELDEHDGEDSYILGVIRHHVRSSLRPDFNWRSADFLYEELDGWHVDDRLLIVAEGAYANLNSGRPTVSLTELLWKKYGTDRMSDRIQRLALLFHEARHLDATHGGDVPFGHFPCEKDSWLRVTEELQLGGVKYGPIRSAECDWYYAGAYGIDTAIIRTLLRNCRDCTTYDLEHLKLDELHYWTRVQFRLRAPVTIPDLPALRDLLGWAGKTLTTVPPHIHFTALAEYIDWIDRRRDELFEKYITVSRSDSDRDFFTKQHQEVTELVDWIGELDRKGLIDPDHPVSRWSRIVNDDTSAERRARPDPNEQDALRWLKALPDAKAEGYNVPLVWMPPCARFRNGCGAHAANEPPPSPPPPLKSRPPGWLGVNIDDVENIKPDILSEQYRFLKTTRGAVIVSVVDGGPAHKGGFKVGEIIHEINGQEISGSQDLAQKMAAAGSGTKVEFAYSGPRKTGFKYVTLGDRPVDPDAGASPTPDTTPLAERPSFDCATNSKPSERAVCQDGDLSRLDVEMAQLYRKSLKTSPEPVQNFFRLSQQLWLERRNQCGDDTTCLKELYAERIAELKTLATSFRLPKQTYTVSSSASGGVLNMRAGPGTRHPIVVGIPVGAKGITGGNCRPSDDGKSQNKWCRVEWRGFKGWASSCCLVAE